MPASTRPECLARTTIHNVTAAAVGEIHTFPSAVTGWGVAFDIGGVGVFVAGATTARKLGHAIQLGERIARDARRLGHAIQLGERIARDARRLGHAHRRLLRTEQLAQAIRTENERRLGWAA